MSKIDSLSYCNEDEDNDPNEDFEEILSCVECGDMGKCSCPGNVYFIRFGVADMIFVPAAHRQCARDASTLSPQDGKSMPGLTG